MGFLVFFLTALNASAAWAEGLKAPDPKLLVKTSYPGIFHLESPAGHHFNTDAPAILLSDGVKISAKALSKSAADFDQPRTGSGSGKISLYICDDANTFCEKHELSVRWSVPAGEGQKHTPPSEGNLHDQDGSAKNYPKDYKDDGFYDNHPEEAFAEARRSNLPLLIDVYGIWCPPCNDLRDKVFSRPLFKAKAAHFIKLKLDADQLGNENLLEKYRISGLPTVIFASSDGDEISRVVGYRPPTQFFSALALAWTHRDRSTARLKEKADSGNADASERLGKIYADRHEYELAVHYLKGTKNFREALLDSQIHTATDADKEALLVSAIREFPDSPDSLDRRSELAEVYEHQKKNEFATRTRKDLVTAAKKLLAHPELQRGYDTSDADILTEMAGTQEDLGDDAGARESWAAAAGIYRKKYASGAKRGSSVELTYCLSKIGKLEEAEKIFSEMQTLFPNEFTYYSYDARMNLRAKNYEKALGLAEKALQHAYGINRIDVAKTLATIYKEMKKPNLAKKTVADALSSVDLGSDPESRLTKHSQTLKAVVKDL